MKKLLLLLLLIPNLVMAEKISLVCDGVKSIWYGEYPDQSKEKRTYIIQDERLIKAYELDVKFNFPPKTWEKLKWRCGWDENEIKCFFMPGAIKDLQGREYASHFITIDRVSGQIESHGFFHGNLTKFEGDCKVSKKNKF